MKSRTKSIVLGVAGLLLFFLSAFFLASLETESLPKKARSITVKVVTGEFWGSGILIAKQGSKYRILTNHHVLNRKIKTYPIYTPDGKVYRGVVVASKSDFQEDDLAVLEFTGENRKYRLARLGKIPRSGDEVFASGFPGPRLGEKAKGWVFHRGTVWKMLEKPLRGGYRLGYTNKIEKGMSGGPLLDKRGELVGVNGMHAYPLLGRPYLYRDGTTPEEALLDRMVHYSWGIPVNRIPRSLFTEP